MWEDNISHRPTQTHTDEKIFSADDIVAGKPCLPCGQITYMIVARHINENRRTCVMCLTREKTREAGDKFSPGRSPGERNKCPCVSVCVCG